MKGVHQEIKVIAYTPPTPPPPPSILYTFVFRVGVPTLSFVSVSTGVCLRLKSQKVIDCIDEIKPSDFKDQIDENLPQCRDEVAELLSYT